MKFVWAESGDELLLETDKPDLFEFYVSTLNTEKLNHFTPFSTGISQGCITDFEEVYNEVQQILSRFKVNIFNDKIDPFNQTFLNKTHTAWVELSKDQPKIITALRLMGEDYVDKFRNINDLIHYIESMFEFNGFNKEVDHWRTPNPFGTDILSFDRYNIGIVYHNLGRQQYERFLNWDLSWQGRDDFSALTGEVEINLSKPEHRPPSKEYVDWCTEHNYEVIGHFCPLANFKDLWPNLTKYREIMFKNVLSRNNFFFHLAN